MYADVLHVLALTTIDFILNFKTRIFAFYVVSGTLREEKNEKAGACAPHQRG